MPEESEEEKEPVSRTRRAIDRALLAAVLLATVLQWYTHRQQLHSAARIVRHSVFPCSEPITYSIGAIDPRYKISPEELAADLKEAKAVWEAPLKRELFEFAASSGDLTVNLVYDRRQAAIDRLNEIGLQTGQSKAAYQSLKESYDELSARVTPRQARLKDRLAAYERGAAEYNSVVAEYNRLGRATPRQQMILKNARAALRRELEGIKSSERGVNGDIDTLNALATTLNQLIVALNIDVAQYNREGSALGVFEEGHYSVSNGFRAIDIYKYSGRVQLVSLLAHELGHALGLEHVKDPDALMYPLNRGDNLKLSPDDLAELDQACTSPLKRKKRQP